MADIMSQPSASQQPALCFLDLSAELRNEIYRLSLCADLEEGEDIELGLRQNPSSFNNTLYRHQSTRLDLAPGILGTCKQVYAEASSILYGENAFAMTPTTFIDSVGRALHFASQVRFLQINFHEDEMFYFYARLGTWLGANDPAYDLASTLMGLEALPKLRTLSIKSSIQRNYVRYDTDVKTTAQSIAKHLRPVIQSIMMASQKGVAPRVRGALKLCFSLATPIWTQDVHTRTQQVRKLEESTYQELEAALQ